MGDLQRIQDYLNLIESKLAKGEQLTEAEKKNYEEAQALIARVRSGKYRLRDLIVFVKILGGPTIVFFKS